MGKDHLIFSPQVSATDVSSFSTKVEYILLDPNNSDTSEIYTIYTFVIHIVIM
jgi:hypothetical protein